MYGMHLCVLFLPILYISFVFLEFSKNRLVDVKARQATHDVWTKILGAW